MRAVHISSQGDEVNVAAIRIGNWKIHEFEF